MSAEVIPSTRFSEVTNVERLVNVHLKTKELESPDNEIITLTSYDNIVAKDSKVHGLFGTVD
jgi:hypothetical protein